MSNSNPEMLEIVNENEEVIGLEKRSTIHEKGLLHREVHIWFFTPEAEIIFQLRSKNKDTYPNKLDASVGGHVEPGMTNEQTAVKECKEETGLDLNIDDFIFIKKFFKKTIDASGKINNAIKTQFGYLYKGNVEDLKVESADSDGFVKWKIDDLRNLSVEDREKFMPLILTEEFLDMFDEARKLLNI